MKISEFFKTDYVDQASYDNLRKIASVVDGQKNAARKIIHTVLEKKIKQKIKVSQLGSKASEFTEYLHGSMDNVIVGLSQDYTGTNNLPLLHKKGNFGTRFTPEASAPRYIYTYGDDNLYNYFREDDSKILKTQYFEGSKIEPMFFVPSVPILLVNGADGVSSGFRQVFLPRKFENITKLLKDRLLNKSLNKKYLIPHYNNFSGVIEQGENSKQWLIKGIVERVSTNRVVISEVPIGYSLKSFRNVLDELEEKKIIQRYKDKAENDNFLFEVTINSNDLKAWDDDTLLNKLKLIKKESEVYTVIDENNKIKVYDNIEDVLDHYIRIKLEYLALRKSNNLINLDLNIRLNYSKFIFIKSIVENNLKINKRKKSAIIDDLGKIDNVIMKDDSYDYLLNMNIMSLTEERMNKLQDDIKILKTELDALKDTSIEDIWLSEI